MSKKFILKFIIIILISAIQALAINIKKDIKAAPVKSEVQLNDQNVKAALSKINNLIITKQEFEKNKIVVDTELIGTDKDIENLIKEINSNKFINSIENMSIEKIEENWKWNGIIVFTSYSEYRNFHKNE